MLLISHDVPTIASEENCPLLGLGFGIAFFLGAEPFLTQPLTTFLLNLATFYPDKILSSLQTSLHLTHAKLRFRKVPRKVSMWYGI